MIFVDSNIPMYLVGAPHPHKVDSQRVLENLRRPLDTQGLNQLIEKHRDAMRDFPFPSFRVALTRNHAPASINQDRAVRREKFV
jgi:predicted nucleic acid-binding protein